MKKHASLWLIPVVLTSLALSGCHTTNHDNMSGFGTHKHNTAAWGRSPGTAYQATDNNGQTVSKYEAISGYKAKKRPSLVLNGSNKDTTVATKTENTAPRVLFRPGMKDVNSSMSEVTAKAVTMDLTTAHMNNTMPHKKPRIDTLVGRKVEEMYHELLSLQTIINKHDMRMSQLQVSGDQAAGDYYSLLAAINAYLQSGTTPGNPEIVEMWNNAGSYLENLSDGSSGLGKLSNDISQTASKASFLLDAAQSTFGLSGAVEEDHENLTALEDQISQSVVRLNRMLNTINDEINRRNSYLRTERLNMQILSLAIANGELYGKSMSSRLFARVADAQDGFAASGGYQKPPVTPTKRPLVIIKFDRPNIQYQQPLYTALSQALERYPAAQFDIVAVSPQTENPAEMALSSASARRNSEDVLRSMTQMGVPTDRINMGNAQTPNIVGSEVHLYIR